MHSTRSELERDPVTPLAHLVADESQVGPNAVAGLNLQRPCLLHAILVDGHVAPLATLKHVLLYDQPAADEGHA